MAFEELEAIPRGKESPNVYGPADQALEVQQSQLMGSVRKTEKVFNRTTCNKPQPSSVSSLTLPGAALNATSRISTEGKPVIGNLSPRKEAGETSLTMVLGSILSYAVNPITIGTNDFTLALYYELKADETGSGAYTFGTDVGTSFSFATRHNAVSNNAMLLFGGNTVDSQISASAKGKYRVVIRRLSGILYFNINEARSAVTGYSATSIGSIQQNVLNSYSYSDAAYGPANGCDYHLSYLSLGAWSNDTVTEFLRNPWSIFQSTPNRLFPRVPQTPILPSKVGVPGVPEFIREWKQQPQDQVQIDRNNPLTKGLVFCFTPSMGEITGRRLEGVTSSGAGATVSAQSGLGLQQDATHAASLGQIGNLGFGTALSVFTLFNRTGIVAPYGSILNTRQAYDGGTGLALFLNNSGNGQNEVRAVCSTDIVYHDVSATLVDSSKPTALHLNLDSGLAEVYDGGKNLARMLGVSGGNIVQSVTSKILLGSESVSSILSPFNGNIYLSIMWNRRLSEHEIKTFANNPWQIFKPISRKLFVGNNTLPNVQVYREKLTPNNQVQTLPRQDLDHYVLTPVGQWTSKFSAGIKPEAAGMAFFTDGGTIPEIHLPKFKFAVIGQIWVSVISMTEGNNCMLSGEVDNITPYIEDIALNTTDESTNSPGRTMLFLRDNVSGYAIGGYNSTPLATMNDGKPHVIVWRLATGTTLECWIDGVAQTVAYWTNTGYNPNPNGVMEYNPWLHNRNLRGTGQLGSSSTLRTYLYARTKGSSEYARSLAKNPWQLQTPARVAIPNRTPVKAQPLLPKYSLVRTSQPQSLSHVDWSNPVTKGLIAVNVPKSPELISGITAIKGTDDIITYSKGRPGFSGASDGDVSNSRCMYFPKRSFSARTEVLIAAPKSLGQYSLFTRASPNGKDGILTQHGASNLTWVVHGTNWNEASTVFAGTSPKSLTEQENCIVFRWSKDLNGGFGKCNWNGLELSNSGNSGGSPVALTGMSNRANDSADNYLGVGNPNANIYVYAVYDRYLSDAEVQQLQINPWQIFKPTRYPARLK